MLFLDRRKSMSDATVIVLATMVAVFGLGGLLAALV
ncbi:hypothetical protein Mterra_02052 [Calidithermus terrae]|uniref:Uncharacterized protein n=1 Tax=Calidithermus terrae TaxID=1408545 RepID=A0A399ENY4_9DEIN|nr:hypothetical protein Mterra_02052 [Calidithermus terrae]